MNAFRLRFLMSGFVLTIAASTVHGQLEPSCEKTLPSGVGKLVVASSKTNHCRKTSKNHCFGTLIVLLPVTTREQKLVPSVLRSRLMAFGG